MNKDFYRKLHDFVLEHGWLHKLVVGGVKILPGIVYAAYPLLVVYFGVWRRENLLRGILVPAMGFLLVTALRAWINAPRPYEAMGIPSITPKDTKGKSFPSRHAACRIGDCGDGAVYGTGIGLGAADCQPAHCAVPGDGRGTLCKRCPGGLAAGCGGGTAGIPNLKRERL